MPPKPDPCEGHVTTKLLLAVVLAGSGAGAYDRFTGGDAEAKTAHAVETLAVELREMRKEGVDTQKAVALLAAEFGGLKERMGKLETERRFQR